MKDSVVIDLFNIPLKAKDILCLEGEELLKDEFINFFFHMIQERSRTIARSESLPRIRCVLTYLTLADSTAKSFNRFITKFDDVFDVDLVMVPYNIGQYHWALVVVNFKLARFEYYDSLGSSPDQAQKRIQIVKRMFDLEAALKQKPFNFSNPNYIPSLQEIPEQRNGYDCGAFICTYADCLAQDLKLDFTQDNIPNFRLKMVRDIREGKLYYLAVGG